MKKSPKTHEGTHEKSRKLAHCHETHEIFFPPSTLNQEPAARHGSTHSHNYWSNQFLGGLPAPQINLGGDETGGFTGEGAIDMTHFAGDQFFTIASEDDTTRVPDAGSSLGLLLVGIGSLFSFKNSRR